MHPILLAGEWFYPRALSETFHPYDPATKTALNQFLFPISPWEHIEQMAVAGKKAAFELAATPDEQRATFLSQYADAIEANSYRLAEAANLETALPAKTRFEEMEIPRTCLQLRQAAACVRNGDWQRATYDTASHIGLIRGPLGGAVAIFGPSNFPFAYNSICGGDFAGAIAVGNPVIAKAHPGHPNTTRLLAELAVDCLKSSGLPPSTIQLFYHCANEDGIHLVQHPDIAAVSFTGSRPAGLALKQAADQVGTPVYVELSSVNPVFLLEGSLVERYGEIAQELHQSCTNGGGQFCTKPGLIVVPDSKAGKLFTAALNEGFFNTMIHPLLSAGAVDAIESTVRRFITNGARLLAGGQREDRFCFAFQPTLLSVTGERFLEEPDIFQSEVFGPVSLVVDAADAKQILEIARCLEGSLTASIYSSRRDADEAEYAQLVPLLRYKAGRLLNDKPPTGVAVNDSMNHGGPFPATGHPGFSAVGFPQSMQRFTSLQCFDNVRPDRLPQALQRLANQS